ncbi:MAG: VWA domain-containing protein, partial [Ruminococcus sp.]|nr:VWA domain-containing protein [Ruminococcus sp.]
MNKKAKLKRLLAGAMSTVMTIGAVPIVSVNAEESTKPYPYAMFAASSAEGAITINAGNFGINGNISTNGTIESEGNVNINGTRTENADEDMIYIFDKIDTEYFSGNNVEAYTEDYTLEEMNININTPLEVAGETVLTGNININTAVKAFENVTLNGEVKNTNNSVIFSKYGDIIIDSSNVNLNGLVYAPFGKVEITAQNLNLNNVVIIADSIIFNCPSVNANYSNNAAEFAGCISETLNIPYEEWQYMKDENKNDIPDFFEDFDNWSKMSDTDSDGLPDSIEISIGSNPEVTDSDSDGLDDYYELMVSFTSPIKPDSDDNGINDGDEDFDKDGLTNFEEYSLATDPWEEDSDDDGLKDGEEVNNYGTNPLEPDTDFDGLIDSDEIYLGTDPNNPDTNGNGILDGDERSEQTIEQDIQVEDEKVAAITKVAVTFDCPGNIERYVTIENTYNIDMLSSDVVGIVGSPVEITSSVDFDNATITFTYDETLLNGTPEENLAILWYDEENKTYVILDEETVVDTENNTVSYTTIHFSTYLVIDREIWYDCWREKIDYRNSPVTIETAYDIGFVVDVSGSMSGEYLNKAKTALNTFIDAMYPCDNAFLVKFNSYGNVVSKYGSSKSELKNAVSSLSAGGGTSTNSGLNAAMNEMIPHISSDNIPIIILICDGDVEYNDKTKNLIETAQNQENPIAIYTVNVCHSNSQALASIAAQTGGVPYDAATSDEIASAMTYIQKKTVSSVDMTDSDGDGLYDVYEVKGMKIQNGQIIYTDPNNADTDNDGISDFNELNAGPICNLVKFQGSEYSCVMCNANTNPVEVDSDNDGYTDDIDPEPNDKTTIKLFGTQEYFDEVEKETRNIMDILSSNMRISDS